MRSDLDAEETERAISDLTDPDDIEEEAGGIPDTRRRGLDRLAISATARFTPKVSENSILDHPAGALRMSQTKAGAFKNGELGSTITTVGASVATGLRDTGVSLSADTTIYTLDYADDRASEKGRQFNVSAYKQFEDFTLRTQYRNDKVEGEPVEQSLNATLSRRAFNLPLPKNANVSIAPSVRALWNGEDVSAQGGIYANLNSGNILGKKTKLSASLGVLQSLSSQDGNGQNATEKFLTVGLSRRVRLGKNMAVGLAYRNDLNGNQRIGLQLDGRFEFNEARKYRETKEGRGVLKGRTFLDANRDGIKQEDEVAIPRAMVRVKGTRMALRTDNAGYFTIQNIKEGLYEVQIDAQSLPLGYDLSEDVSTRVTIADGQISDVPLPIVQRGQIRGFTFVDENDNGEFDKGEERVEGAKLKLVSTDGTEKATVYSSSFGQYAFDDLPSGEYEIVTLSNEKAGIVAGASVTVNLADAKDLMARANLIVKRKTKPIRHARVIIEDIDNSAGNILDQPGTVPPPDQPLPDTPNTMASVSTESTLP
ncbi:collagen binding domain-containing protein [Litorimonas sp. RW-G-Af-16]|uniref:MSCRAMM family protein n=1 Tax=Litorimonas sp. RW-G-Af-16 TaxID=3241168 RepID=UPI003AB07459